MIHRPLHRLLVLVALATGCASAEKRLEQGMESEAEGSYYQAAIRYVEALEKDAALGEARDRLLEASDSAVSIGVAAAASHTREGNPVGAAEEFLTLDRLIGGARGVGVRVPTPTEYTEERRSAFDDAIAAFMARSEDAANRRQWGEARQALNRVRRDLAPSAAQSEASQTAEAYLLLTWAESEENDGRLRGSFVLAGEALASLRPAPADLVDGAEALRARAMRPCGLPGDLLLTWAESEENDGRLRGSFVLAGEALASLRPAPADLVDGAEALRARAIANGTRALAVFPVTVTAPVREQMDGDLDEELADLLELVYWRAPPPFLVVSDPVVVRQVLRRFAPPGRSFRPGRRAGRARRGFRCHGGTHRTLRCEERNLRRRSRQARTKTERWHATTLAKPARANSGRTVRSPHTSRRPAR